MTEKRFTLDYVRGKPNFWDNHCDLTDCYLTCEDVVNRLNKYDEENEQLKSKLQTKQLRINLFNSKNTSLKEENKQLKQQKDLIFEQIKGFRDDCYVYCDFGGVSTLNRLLEILDESMELFE